jgi:hypothetical protein
MKGSAVHIWDKVEIELQAKKDYTNPYCEIEVWVMLEGPGFRKKVYGFWDGGKTFKVRIAPISAGKWSWSSGSNTDDEGLNGIKGSVIAAEWTEEEKTANPCRRGMVVSSENGRGFQYYDKTPYFMIGDTWWSAPTYRYPWYNDDMERPIGPEMGFKDMVRYRKKQGYNCIAMLAGHPTWANDGLPPKIKMKDAYQTSIRAAWRDTDSGSAKDMHNEGGRPFLFPGKVEGYENVVPDFDKINPEYFKHLDLKIDYLNEKGFTVFIEVIRRDVSQVWKRYGGWPDSYVRYIHYIFTRYQANNCLFSPIHFDFIGNSILPREYNEPANTVIDKYGHPPFGTLLGTNASPSTLCNFGGPEENRWLTFHQIGNWREHDHYWYLTEIFQSEPARPAINGEPYYPGFPDDNPETGSVEAEVNCRSGMYGSFLSGGLGGYIYGIEGMWGSDIEKNAKYKMWEVLEYRSGALVYNLKRFIDRAGNRYVDLIPNVELITPNKSGAADGYTGWAYCAATANRDLLLLYFEQLCLQGTVRGLKPNAPYLIEWFNPVTGEWKADKSVMGTICADNMGRIILPKFPGKGDWGLYLEEI